MNEPAVYRPIFTVAKSTLRSDVVAKQDWAPIGPGPNSMHESVVLAMAGAAPSPAFP